MSPHLTQDTCIPYGRGGAGNMRRRSSIASAWATILSHPSRTDKLSLTSSPEEHYAASKTELRRRRCCSSTSEEERKSSIEEARRTSRSSVWSRNTSTTGRYGSRWRSLFRRGGRREGEEEKDDSAKGGDVE